jgi:hypothetical protein
MESFVTNTYGNFQSMSAGVEQLCKELTLPTEVKGGTPSKPDSIGTAIGEIRRLIDQGGYKRQQFEAIQTSGTSLVQEANTDLEQRVEVNMQQNQGMSSTLLPNSLLSISVLETLVTLLEKQHQDQEALLREVASSQLVSCL